jgi:spermidine synthase
LPNIGSQQTLVCLAMLNLFSGMLLFVTSSLFTGFIRKGVSVALSCMLFWFVLQMPNDLLKEIFLRNTQGKVHPDQLIYLDEGLTTTVAVFDEHSEYNSKRLILNGINMSADNMNARKYMTLLSYIPLLLTDNPKDVLVICFGTGQTAGAAGAYPGINLVDAVDISPGVFRAGKFFKATNHDVINNPKVNKINQDGRQHLLTTSTTYDVITAEPPPPSSAGTVNLYTKEYYELTKRALKPGGIVSQWIPLHSQTETHVYQSFRTFLESFPYAMAWYPVTNELILIGSNQPINIEFQNIEQRLQNPVTQKIMSDIDFPSPFSFLGSIWFLKKELKSLGAGQRIISDNNPTLEYYLNDHKNKLGLSEDGVSRIIESRSSVDDVWEQITQSSYFLSKVQKDTFKEYWARRLNSEYADKSFKHGVRSTDPGEAIAHYRKALSYDISHVRANVNLGAMLQAIGKNKEAILHYRTVIKLNPKYLAAHNNLGSALLQIGETAEAILHFETAIQLHPESAVTHFNLGNAFRVQQKIGNAISHYKMSIKLKPDSAEAHNNLGTTLLREQKYEEAISHYRMAVKLKPDFAEAHNNLGTTLLREQKYEEAISHYRMAVKLKPDFAMAHNNLKKAISKLEKQ